MPSYERRTVREYRFIWWRFPIRSGVPRAAAMPMSPSPTATSDPTPCVS